MKSFSPTVRQENINHLKIEEFDLLIIGGGINGAGIARDASMRGLKVALIERNDFASGTSSKSSKLIHGGIRYLENLEFKLVFEALNERTKLFEMAPHLVHPLRFIIPLYENSRVGMFKMGLGMWLYDLLALMQSPQIHDRLSPNELKSEVPILQLDKIVGAYEYSDAYMDDDRLVIETLRSANEHGATIANYVKASGVRFNPSGHISEVIAEDVIGGENNKNTFSIRCKHVISAVGPWTDELGEKLFSDWKKILRPTKGVHLTFSKNRLPLEKAVVMAAEKGNRIVFAIPRHEMVIIGTTDTDFKSSPSAVSTDGDDVEYLLDVANNYFPGAKLNRNDIIASYAGVRPLVFDGAANEGKTSREHTIFSDPRGVTFVAGGKYTTYRLVAEQSVEKALEFFSIEKKAKLTNANTAQPLNPLASSENLNRALVQKEELMKSFKISSSDIELLISRHGLEAKTILTNYSDLENLWQKEAAFAIDQTMCHRLIDFYTRRTPLFLSFHDHGLSLIDDVAQVFKVKLSWSDNYKEKQITELKNFIDAELKWK